MELAGLVFLLLLTGVNAAELQDDRYPAYNWTLEENRGNYTNDSREITDSPDDPLLEYEEVPHIINYLGRVTPEIVLPYRPVEKGSRWTVFNQHEGCRYQDVLNHLGLTRNNDLFTMSRPVLNHTTVTRVALAMAISAILDVRETDQTFIAYVWIHMVWNNEYIYWDPDEFCGIQHVLVPTEILWKPDVILEEMIEKDKAPPSDFIQINSNGNVHFRQDQVVLSTCKMRVYKFPFDRQVCTITFKSFMHSDDEILFVFSNDTETMTELSRAVMRTQYEWLFIKMTVSSFTSDISIDKNQTSIVHTIHMRRRSLLYVANFLMPVVFFLCLDLSSFLISESSGEKLGFKVTVLLAVTVMQLILNEILPCSSDRIPLIAVFCMGIFTLMMLSLLETIVVMHLMGKDSETPQRDADPDGDSKEQKQVRDAFYKLFKGSEDQTASVEKEGSSGQLAEVSVALGKVSDELEKIEKKMDSLGAEKDDGKPGRWTRVAKSINRLFSIFYVTAVVVFLTVIFAIWVISDEEQ